MLFVSLWWSLKYAIFPGLPTGKKKKRVVFSCLRHMIVSIHFSVSLTQRMLTVGISLLLAQTIFIGNFPFRSPFLFNYNFLSFLNIFKIPITRINNNNSTTIVHNDNGFCLALQRVGNFAVISHKCSGHFPWEVKLRNFENVAQFPFLF